MAISTLEQIRLERITKVSKLKELGINPYPSQSQKEASNIELVNNFDSHSGKSTWVAGRLMSWREHGEVIFADLQDEKGKIQLYIKLSNLAATNSEKQLLGWDNLNLLDQGDFVQAYGKVVKTQRGEISIEVIELKLLTKTLRPLPEKWKGIVDQEIRHRKRYLDLTMNQEIRDRFIRRSMFWQEIRSFLITKGFYEINIPVLELTTGGAEANPFVTHMDSIDQDFFLRISHELPLKRLIGGGYEKVFDIGPRFRNEGLSDEHLPEHVAMEFYWAYADYLMGMKLLKEMYIQVLGKVFDTTKFNIKGFEVDLEAEWKEIDYAGIIKERFDVDVYNDSEEKMLAVVNKNNIKFTGIPNRNRLSDKLWKEIRKTIAGPAFLINDPKFISPLAKSRTDNPAIAERIQIMLAGSELGNGWSELNDAQDQLERFKEQEAMRSAGDEEAMMLDVDYIEMLEYGMPPTFGFGLSERVFWFFENVTAKEGVPFPPVKHNVDILANRIYGLNQLKSKEIKPLTTVDLSSYLKPNTKVNIADSVKTKFPMLGLNYIIIKDLVIPTKLELIDELKLLVKTAVQNQYPTISEVKEIPGINAFRKIYKETGANPNNLFNSAEALIRRLVSGKDIYNINALVDLYNSISAYFAIPMAAYDLAKIQDKIELDFSKAGETITIIGSTIPEDIELNRLVYRDSLGVICRDLNYRDSDRTKITLETKEAIIFLDKNEEIEQERLNSAMELFISYITKLKLGQITEIAII